MSSQEVDGPPAWDEGLAAYAPGKYVLIGITYLDVHGEVSRLDQMHGVIESADAHAGFTVALKGARTGETYKLPPDPRGFQPAPPGEYRLHESGELIVDPDLFSTWTLYEAAAGDD